MSWLIRKERIALNNQPKMLGKSGFPGLTARTGNQAFRIYTQDKDRPPSEVLDIFKSKMFAIDKRYA